jgi:hypothetical protein
VSPRSIGVVEDTTIGVPANPTPSPKSRVRGPGASADAGEATTLHTS